MFEIQEKYMDTNVAGVWGAKGRVVGDEVRELCGHW